MKLRALQIENDFDRIKNWITDKRTHALWCANLLQYPINKENFEHVLSEDAIRYGDSPFVVTTSKDKAIGFFLYSFNGDTKEGLLRFVVVDPEYRGKGVAVEMLKLVALTAFKNSKTEAIQLNLFSENIRAKKCYEKVGFKIRKTTPNAFTYEDESWEKCNMVLRK